MKLIGTLPLAQVYSLVRVVNDRRSKCKVILTGNYLTAGYMSFGIKCGHSFILL